MGQMITLKDGRNAAVCRMRDLLELIDFYCGYDMRCLIRDGIRDLEKENEELKLESDDCRRTLECNSEEQRELLLSVRDNCEEILEVLAASKLNRRRLVRMVKELYRLVNDEL